MNPSVLTRSRLIGLFRSTSRPTGSHYAASVAESRPGGLAGILTAMRQHWIAASVAFLIVLVPAGFLIVTQKSEYQAQAVVGLIPERSMSDSFLRSIAKQLPTVLLAPEVTTKVGQKTGMTADEVQHAVTIEIPAATLNMDITALSGDPQTAAQLANEMASEALANTSYKEFFSQRLLSPAVAPTHASGLGRSLLLAAALLIAVVVAAVVALLARDLSVGSTSSQADLAEPASDSH